MNLHALVAPVIGAVNPLTPVGLQISTGLITNADYTKTPSYATPGAFTASIGGTFTAYSTGTTLTVTAVLTGSLQASDFVSGTDGTNSLPANTTIVEQLTGTTGGVGTYEMSAAGVPSDLASCEITSLSDTLNVTTIAMGVLQAGQDLADASGALTAGTLITGQISGSVGSVGLYSLNQAQTVALETMSTTMTIIAQLQAATAGDLRQVDGVNLQGSHKVLYASGDIRGIIRYRMKGGDMVTMPDGSLWLITQPLEPWNTAGWSKCLLTLQNISGPAFNPLIYQPTTISGV